MPNWCQNDVTIQGPKTTLSAMLDALEANRAERPEGSRDHLSLFDTFLPIPEVLVGTTSPSRPPFSESQIASERDSAKRIAMEDAVLEYERARALAIDQTGFDNWYDWSLATYGSKWSDSIYESTMRARSLVLKGETPWGPPTEGLAALSALLGVTIRNRWYEGGMGVQGRQEFRGGELVLEENGTYQGHRGG